jgi:hypothetical protein
MRFTEPAFAARQSSPRTLKNIRYLRVHSLWLILVYFAGGEPHTNTVAADRSIPNHPPQLPRKLQ